MTAPAVSPRAMTNRPTNSTDSGGRLMRILFDSIGKRVGPTRAEGIRPASPVSMRWTGRRTSQHPGDRRLPGMLTEACFNKRADARPHDRANRCEFIVGSYYLFESLLVLAGRLDPLRV